MAIKAKRKDGTPVQIGDWVLVMNATKRKFSGRIVEINEPKRFQSLKNAFLQIYTVKTPEGDKRPVLAWHIKCARETTKFKQGRI